MGTVKNHDYYEDAKAILIEIDAIKTCDAHDDFFYTTGSLDNDQIYSRATNLFKEKYGEDCEFFKEFHEAIKLVLTDAAFESDCPYCNKAFSE